MLLKGPTLDKLGDPEVQIDDIIVEATSLLQHVVGAKCKELCLRWISKQVEGK